MSKENKVQKYNSVLLILLLFLGLSIVSLFSYLFYNFFFSGKMYKSFPKDTDGFIEFRLNLFDSFNDFLPKEYFPWFYSYKDKIDPNKHGAILFYKGKKVDALYAGSKWGALNILEGIKLQGEVINESGAFISMSQSSVPSCIYYKYFLLCSEDKDVLNQIAKDESNIRENKDFLKIENNLYYRNDIFVFVGTKMLDNFPMLKKRFNGIGFSFKEDSSKFSGLFYGALVDGISVNSKNRKRREHGFENSMSLDGTVFAFGGIDLEKQIKDSFEFYKKENPYYALLAKGLIDGSVKNIFGSNVQFFNDILPLFSGEFLFAIKQSDKKFDLEIITEKTKSLDNLFANFEKQSKRFLPFKETFQYNELTLEQITSKNGVLKDVNDLKKGSRIKGWEIEGKQWGLYFIEKDGLIRIATDLNVLTGSLDKKSPTVQSNLPYSPYSFEFGFVDTDKINSLFKSFGFDKKLPEDKKLGWQTLWFSDGIQTKFIIR